MNEVEEYYDKSQKWYSWFYSDRESLGMHFGFSDDETSHKESLLNQYRVLKDILDPKDRDLVLDAGCGVGGAIIFLAKNTKANCVGITISPVQKKIADKLIKGKSMEDRIKIYLMDYFNTSFDDNTFDSVFGIESLCYAYPNPERVYKEIFRILKPGGKLFISDGVIIRDPLDEKEKNMIRDFCKGFRLDGMCKPEGITCKLKDIGFVDIKTIDKTKDVKNSVEYFYKLYLILKYPLKLLRFLRLVSEAESDNLLAALNLKRMYDSKLCGYKIFVAHKPS